MSVTVKIAPGQLGAVLIASVKRHRAAIDRGIQKGAALGAGLLARKSPVDEGLFKNAWRAYGNEIRNPAPYAGIIERGARPHLPPLEPLLGWVERHASDLGVSSGDEREVLDVANAIRFKIAREGQKPTWLVRDSLGQLRDIARAEIESELRRSLAQGGT